MKLKYILHITVTALRTIQKAFDISGIKYKKGTVEYELHGGFNNHNLGLILTRTASEILIDQNRLLTDLSDTFSQYLIAYCAETRCK